MQKTLDRTAVDLALSDTAVAWVRTLPPDMTPEQAWAMCERWEWLLDVLAAVARTHRVAARRRLHALAIAVGEAAVGTLPVAEEPQAHVLLAALRRTYAKGVWRPKPCADARDAVVRGERYASLTCEVALNLAYAGHALALEGDDAAWEWGVMCLRRALARAPLSDEGKLTMVRTHFPTLASVCTDRRSV